MTPNHQFRTEAASVYRTLKFAQQACFLVLALTSVFLVFTLSLDFFSQRIQHSTTTLILANLVTIAAYFAVDGALSTFLPYVAREMLNQSWKTHSKNRRRFARILGIVCLIQLIITGTLSWWSSGEIADVSVSKPSNDSFTEAAILQNNVYDRDRSVLEQELSTAKSSEAKRIGEAKKEAKVLLNDAINSKGKAMAKLYRDGNRWAAKQLSKVINRAKEKGESLIQLEKSKAPTLQANLLGFIQQKAVNKDSIILQLGSMQLGDIQAYQTKKKRRTQTMIIVDLIAAFGALFFTFLIALFISETEANPHASELTAKRLVSEGLRQKWQGILSRLAEKWKVRFALTGPLFLPVSVQQAVATGLPYKKNPAAVNGLANPTQPPVQQKPTAQTTDALTEKQGLDTADTQIDSKTATDNVHFLPPTANQHFDNAGQKRTPDAQEIVRFIKRFRERFRQSLLAKDDNVRKRNTDLMLQDWIFLESMGYKIERVDRVGKLRIAKG